jgi:phosphate starvation-inducible PhoH-like protein
MPNETLHFENDRLAQQLYNHDARNLQALEQHLGVKATAREGWIKLEGEAEAIERAKTLFLQLEGQIQSGTTLRNRDFAHALHVVKHDGAAALKEIMAHRIATSDRKSGVTPKTVGQKRYVEAIRRHDITFGGTQRIPADALPGQWRSPRPLAPRCREPDSRVSL